MSSEIDIKEADKKILLAAYLVNRQDNLPYLPAAVKHILTAANIAIQYLTSIDDNRISSPQLTIHALEKFEEKEALEFANFYINLWKSVGGAPNPTDVANSLNTVKAFVSWVKTQK